MTSAAATVQWAQLDDMNITSAHPVVAREGRLPKHSSSGGSSLGGGKAGDPPLFDVKITTKASLDGQVRVYPYIRISVTPAPLHLCVHEPLIWRLSDFASHLEFADPGSGGSGGGGGGGRSGGGGGDRSTTLGADKSPSPSSSGGSSNRADMPLLIGLMRVSAVRLRLSFRAAPDGRPRRALKALSSGPLSVANLDDMPLELRSLTVGLCTSRIQFTHSLKAPGFLSL
jgi:hypothetical protein